MKATSMIRNNDQQVQLSGLPDYIKNASARLKKLIRTDFHYQKYDVYHEIERHIKQIKSVDQEKAFALTDYVAHKSKQIESYNKSNEQNLVQSWQRARQMLSQLLDADDILFALEEHKDQLDIELLALVHMNMYQERTKGNKELADGLQNLAEYIRNKLQVV